MKVLIFSDIHGLNKNVEYLKKLEANEKFDKIIILGDIYNAGIHHSSKYYNPDSIRFFLKSIKNKLIVIKGNRDFEIDQQVNMQLGPKLIKLDQHKVLIFHGNEDNLDYIDDAKILIHGHEHIPYIEIKGEFINICVGSISLPRAGSKESYVIYQDGRIIIYSINNEIIDYIEM